MRAARLCLSALARATSSAGLGIERGDVRVWQRVGERNGDGSRAGADVGDADRRVVRESMEGGLDEVLGFGARNQHIWRDAESEAVEFLLFKNVLDGLVPGAAVKPLLVDRTLRGVKFRVGIGEKKCAIMASGVTQQKFGVAACGEQVLQTLSAIRACGGKSERWAVRRQRRLLNWVAICCTLTLSDRISSTFPARSASCKAARMARCSCSREDRRSVRMAD